jgi:hypothetical protein
MATAQRNSVELYTTSSQGPVEEKVESSRVEHARRIIMREDDALAFARANPQDANPLYISLDKDDPANPRNWSPARKYYIAALASMLNCVT